MSASTVKRGLRSGRRGGAKGRQESGRPFHLLYVLIRGGPWTLSLIALYCLPSTQVHLTGLELIH